MATVCVGSLALDAFNGKFIISLLQSTEIHQANS